MILDDQQLGRTFEQSNRLAASLKSLADELGATPIADYAWTVGSGAGVVRHLRRATPVGEIGVLEEGSSTAGGETWTLRVQIVSWDASPAHAIVRKQSAHGDDFWEMHVGDGNPRPIPEANLAAGFAFVKAALEAVARR